MLLGSGELAALGLDFQRCWPCECRTATSVLPFLHGPSHAVNGQVLACFDDAGARKRIFSQSICPHRVRAYLFDRNVLIPGR